MVHTPRKRFGQNFLIDQFIIDRIVELINPQPGQHIVEIGPGLGALTAPLVQSGAIIDAVELDRDLAQTLHLKFLPNKNFRLHSADILEFELEELFDKYQQKLRVVGNLPYNISTQLMFKLFANLSIVQDMYFMLQREVGVRLSARPNSKDYGRMSVMAQYFCEMRIAIDVPPHSFNPAPKVESCVVQFVPYPTPPHPADDPALLHQVVAHAFNHRRKRISNSLKDLISATELNELGIDPILRAENLSVFDYVQISNYISSKS